MVSGPKCRIVLCNKMSDRTYCCTYFEIKTVYLQGKITTKTSKAIWKYCSIICPIGRIIEHERRRIAAPEGIARAPLGRGGGNAPVRPNQARASRNDRPRQAGPSAHDHVPGAGPRRRESRTPTGPAPGGGQRRAGEPPAGERGPGARSAPVPRPVRGPGRPRRSRRVGLCRPGTPTAPDAAWRRCAGPRAIGPVARSQRRRPAAKGDKPTP